MPVPAAITDLSPTPSSNSPAGSESVILTDDYLRTLAAFVRQVYNRLTDGTSPATVGDLTSSGVTVLGNGSLRINASGQIQLGLSSAGINGRLQVQSNSATENVPVFVNDTRADAASSFSFTFARQGVAVGSISTTPSGTSYNTTSDRRLKTAIVDAPDAGADIDAIRVRSFDWLADGTHQAHGFIAQELAGVAPYAVHQPEDPEQMLSVDYSKLVPLLVKEVQALRARLATLEARA